MSLRETSYRFIKPLNSLRFFAALAIVMYHYGRWSFPFSLQNFQPFVLISNVGVTLFFVLSGFIMVHVYGKKLLSSSTQAVQDFYRARAARIVPLYIVARLLTIWNPSRSSMPGRRARFFYSYFSCKHGFQTKPFA